MIPEIKIGNRLIGAGYAPYVIAELSGNHNGQIGRALALVDAAKQAGADAVKLQTYTPDTMTIDCNKADFKIEGGPWGGRYLYELYGEAQTPWSWHEQLFARAKELKLDCFSTPFDETAVDFLESLDAPIHKIASFELVDTPLIRKAAKTGKPLIMSTGMATVEEVDEAVAAAKSAGAGGIVLLHCISAYPAPAEEANLARIRMLQERYDLPIGLSDHTMGSEVAVAAVALGAAVVEKHITLARADGGPDAGFSLEPAEFKTLVDGVRIAQRALGHREYGRTQSETPNLAFRRSLYVVRDIAAGEVFTRDHVRSIRPGYGLAPKHLDDVIGKKAASAISRGTALKWELIA